MQLSVQAHHGHWLRATSATGCAVTACVHDVPSFKFQIGLVYELWAALSRHNFARQDSSCSLGCT